MSQYNKNPKPKYRNDSDKCADFALSMFVSLDAAKKRFEELKDQMGEKIYKRLGTKIAEGKLTTFNGMSGKPDRKGHFNHHPYIGTNFTNSFRITNDIL